MIVKVQRPLVTMLHPGDAQILAYAEGRKNLTVMHDYDLPTWLQKALEADPKLYVEASWTGRRWQFEKIVGEQPW